MKECFWLKIEARIGLSKFKNPFKLLLYTIISPYWTYMPGDWIFVKIDKREQIQIYLPPLPFPALGSGQNCPCFVTLFKSIIPFLICLNPILLR